MAGLAATFEQWRPPRYNPCSVPLTPRKRRSGSNLGSWRRYALHALRVLLVALAFQVSGLSTAAMDAAESCTCEASDCPLEKQGEPCPPGCPQCHCVHSAGLATPASQLALVSAAGSSVRVGLDRLKIAFVGSPLRSNPYRPPRTLARA